MNIRSVQWMQWLILALLVMMSVQGCQKASGLQTIQTQKAEGLVISLLGESGDLKRGKNDFVVEFKSSADQRPVDAGHVSMASIMEMPGMSPMSAGVELTPAGEPGRYQAKANFEMSGAWKFTIDWDGPAGKGKVTFNSSVR